MKPTKTPPKKSWASALQAEILAAPSPFTPEHKTFEEVREELRAVGLPSGRSYTCRWLQKMVDEGKAEMASGSELNGRGGRKRAVKYLLK